jgi:hypothetical protein
MTITQQYHMVLSSHLQRKNLKTIYLCYHVVFPPDALIISPHYCYPSQESLMLEGTYNVPILSTRAISPMSEKRS